MQKIIPCLWFDGKAIDAARFYISLFQNSKLGRVAYFGEAGAAVSGQEKGSVMTIEFELNGTSFLGLNGGPDFKFSPAVSFFIECSAEEEINNFWKQLSKDGSILWELQKYPWSEKYGWCQDKNEVPWQVMLTKNKTKISPAFLFMGKLFGKGEEAIKFYTNIFKNSKIENIHRDPNTNIIMHSTFLLEGQEFVLMEGQGAKNYEITPAISLVLNCDTQAEIDYYWDKLSHGGTAGQCGWLEDQFGISWQIVPSVLSEMMSSSDTKKTENAMKAMLKMTRLDIEKLVQAFKF